MTAKELRDYCPDSTVASKLKLFRGGVSGVYAGIPAAEYHALRAVSSTILKTIYTASPLAAHAAMIAPEQQVSEAMEIGEACHAMILTPDQFDQSYVRAGQCESSVKSTGERCCRNSGVLHFDGHWFCGIHSRGLCHDLGGKVLTVEEYRRVRGIHDAVWNHAAAGKILRLASDHELSVLWTGGDGKVLCKARFDLLCRSRGILSDLKSCRSIKPDLFQTQAFKLGYHLQLAHYLEGARRSGFGELVCSIIAAESEEPFDVVVFEPTARLMDLGAIERDAALDALLRCRRDGKWPGYSEKVLEMDVPEWTLRKETYGQRNR